MKIKTLFYNAHEQRTRFLWRVIVQIVLMLLLSIIPVLILQLLLILGLIGSIRTDTAGGMLVFSLIMLFSIMASIWLAGRWMDRRGMSGFGLHINSAWWQDFAFGLGLGVGLISLVFLVEWVFGFITIDHFFQQAPGMSFSMGMVTWAGVYFCVGIYEEMLFRGYYLTNLAEWLGRFRIIKPRMAVILALVFTSLAFGVAHANNPNASLLSSLNITLVGIFLLGLGYVLTGEMGISIGLHMTWNFFQGNVFGFPVSGLQGGQSSIIAITQNGPEWLTGGSFGPEAGLLGLLATLLGAVIIILWVKQREGQTQIDVKIAEAPQDFIKVKSQPDLEA